LTLLEDFKDEIALSVTIQPFVSSDGFKDTYGAAQIYLCMVSYKIQNIIKEDGIVGITTMQIFVNANVSVSKRDKITFNGFSPKVLKIQPNYDIEHPTEIYSVIIFT
jgi:hypothetical protein